MNQISTRYVTEGEACYEQYVLSDPAAKTELVITPERGGMITGFTLDGDEYIWVRRPNFSECNRPRFAVPILFPSCSNPDGGVHIFDGKPYPMETHGLADLCPWEVDSVGPDGVTLMLQSTPLTKFLYPFDFTLLVTYNLAGRTATIDLTVINDGDKPMPFSFGYHPYFVASKLENVDFDIHCATCSEDAKGEQPRRPGEDHPDPQRGRGQLHPPADRRGVPHGLYRQRQRPQGDGGRRRQFHQRRALAAGRRELRLHGALERLGQQRQRGGQARGAGARRGHDQHLVHQRSTKCKDPPARPLSGIPPAWLAPCHPPLTGGK